MLPLSFVGITALVAGYQSIRDNFLPLALDPSKGKVVTGWIDTVITAFLMTCLVIVVADMARKWRSQTVSGAAGVGVR